MFVLFIYFWFLGLVVSLDRRRAIPATLPAPVSTHHDHVTTGSVSVTTETDRGLQIARDQSEVTGPGGVCEPPKQNGGDPNSNVPDHRRCPSLTAGNKNHVLRGLRRVAGGERKKCTFS